MDMIKRGSILLIENDTIDFYKARLPLALFLVQRGWFVNALVPENEDVSLIEKAGIKTFIYKLSRRNKGILHIFNLLFIYRAVIKKHKYNYIHSFRFQPNLVNVLLNFFNKQKIVIHITGLGIAFSNESFKYKFLRVISHIIYQVKFVRANKIIFQNPDDVANMWFHKFWRKKIEIIYGSGVNTLYYKNNFYNTDQVRLRYNVSSTDFIFLCVSRLIWEKGILEMVKAFQKIKQEGFPYKLWIVGWPDEDNPRHVETSFIDSFQNDGTILFLGKQDNVRELLASADVFLYPSYYREGVPRAILEALSMSLPIITTDMPGCKLTVKNGVNGYLITPRSDKAIYTAVLKIAEKEKVSEMGKFSRFIAEDFFSESVIFSQIENIYN